MSDEIKNEQQEQQIQPEVVVDETLDVKSETEETEVKDEPKAEVQDVAEDSATDEKDVQAEEATSEVQEDVPSEESEVEEVATEDSETTEESETKPDEVPEASQEVVEVKDDELEKAKAELAEKEAELQEEKAIKSYEDDVREANHQLDEFLVNLGNAMAQEFAKYGIDANTNLEELKKQDPAKAQVAMNIINQAQAVKAQAMTNVQNNLNDRLTDVIFTKASRLFDKFELTAEQGEVAAETFVNILAQSGVKDMGDDLLAKVELAVARARMLKPKVEKLIEDAKEVAGEAIDAVKDIIEEKAPEEKKEENKVEEKEEKQEETPQPESVVETPTLDEFKEGAVVSNQEAGGSITEDNVMQKMAELPFKERTAFYKEHRELIEKAAKKETIKRAGNNKV